MIVLLVTALAMFCAWLAYLGCFWWLTSKLREDLIVWLIRREMDRQVKP